MPLKGGKTIWEHRRQHFEVFFLMFSLGDPDNLSPVKHVILASATGVFLYSILGLLLLPFTVNLNLFTLLEHSELVTNVFVIAKKEIPHFDSSYRVLLFFLGLDEF